MERPSFGFGPGMTIPATGITIRFRDRAFGGVTVTNTGATDVYVLANVIVTGSADGTTVGLDDITTSVDDAKFKTYTATQARANGILVKASGGSVQITGYEMQTGKAVIRRLSLLTATGTTTVTGGTTDLS
jgi:hypothetical protein